MVEGCSKLMEKFRAVTMVKVYSGDIVLFWFDHWQLDNENFPLKERFPRLHSYCPDKSISVREFIQTDDVYDLFSLPLSKLAYNELNQLSVLLANFNLNQQLPDSWLWRHGKISEYTASKYYGFVH